MSTIIPITKKEDEFVDKEVEKILGDFKVDPVHVWCEEIFEECIEPYLHDLGSIEAQLALEKKLRQILRDSK